MKQYTKLPLPKNSAWDRFTIRKYLPSWVKNIIDGTKNIIKWSPLLYTDRDWDHSFILKTLQKKIEFQRKYIVEHNRHTDVDIDNFWMTVVLNLIERQLEEYYTLELFEYEETKDKFIPSIEHEGYYEWEIEITSERWDEYLKKYPASLRKVKQENPDLNGTRDICRAVSHYNQKKNNKLLFNILQTYLYRWWD